MTEFVTVYEVAPRDGLQNETQYIAANDKIALINQLSQTGLSKIEVTSFVSPKWVPQMADAAEVMVAIDRVSGVTYGALTPNMRGFSDALAAKADEMAIFASASEGFSQKNINCSIADSLQRFAPVARAAKDQGIPLRGYLSCVIACPYDGSTAPAQVVEVVKHLLALGCFEISLGDTIGQGDQTTVHAMLNALTQDIPPEKLAGHFHDTNGNALANIETALKFGLRVFDAAVGGLGGCPYAPGAQGNVASEAVVARLQQLGHPTGVDLPRLQEVAKFAQTLRNA